MFNMVPVWIEQQFFNDEIEKELVPFLWQQ
jgi:hypothetical protein